MPEWLQHNVFGYELWKWLGLTVAIFLGFVIKLIVQNIVDLFEVFTKKTKVEWDNKLIEAIDKPIGLIVATGFWLYVIHYLEFEGMALKVLAKSNKAVLSFALVWAGYRLSSVMAYYLISTSKKSTTLIDDGIANLLETSIKVTVLVIGSLMAIQNLGVNVGSLLAGLGLGGVAIALAAKDTASNFFGSVMILTDKPFITGDFIIANGVEGVVEDVGFRSTRIRTFYNSQVTIPNSQLANVNIDNMGRRQHRRMKVTLGLTYDTTPAKMKQFVDGIKDILEKNPNIKEGYVVGFNNYGPSSLDVLVNCHIMALDWVVEVAEREKLFTKFYELAESIGVSFAFPTQTLHIDSMPQQNS